MTTAHIQPLTFRWWRRLTGWMIVIVRVYDDGNGYLIKSPYKFITVGVIYNDDIYIHGMSNSFIGIRDLKAMDKKLHEMGIKMAHWSHAGKNHAYKLKG